jgi:hypothetical protein
MVTIADFDNERTHSSKKSFNDFLNEKILANAQTPKFEDDLKFVCNILNALIDTKCVIDKSKVIEQMLRIMRTNWVNYSFNKEIFLIRLNKYGFKSSSLVFDIRAEIFNLGRV